MMQYDAIHNLKTCALTRGRHFDHVWIAKGVQPKPWAMECHVASLQLAGEIEMSYVTLKT